MEMALRAALIAWLAADPILSESLNAVTEETPLEASLPWLAVAASASIDWSSKSGQGREVRIALELHARADTPDAVAPVVAMIEERVRCLPRDQGTFAVIVTEFLRSRSEQRSETVRGVLLEYRFRILAQLTPFLENNP